MTDSAPSLAPLPRPVEGTLADSVREHLTSRGALFFGDLHAVTGAFVQDLLDTLWSMVWAGEATNDTLAPLRSLVRGASGRTERKGPRGRSFRSRRLGPPGSEGRWSLVTSLVARPGATERRAALAHVLLERHGVLVREAVQAEGVDGGFSSIYPVLAAMEERGRARRGYFVAGLGAAQFAVPGADDRLRSAREPSDEPQATVLAATDPAQLHGAALPWPESPHARLERRGGAQVVLVDGVLRAYLNRSQRELVTFLPEDAAQRARDAAAVARVLAGLVESGQRRAMLVTSVDGVEPADSVLGPHLAAAGFVASHRGHLKRSASGIRPLGRG